MKTETVGIRRVEVPACGARDAAEHLQRAFGTEGLAAVVLFVSPEVDRAEFAAALAGRFGGAPVVGCTTAGELGPTGVHDGGISGFALPASHFRVAIGRIDSVRDFAPADARDLVGRLAADLRAGGHPPAPANTFAMLLVDGLSACEELVASALDGALGGLAMFGGSAGDAMRFRETFVLADGAFRAGAGMVMLVQTTLPFRVFRSQHLIGTGRRLTVTAADRARRTVMQFDGEPAAVAYARAVGLPPEALSPQVFAAHPVVVRIGGSPFVRSLQRRNPDDSLTFYSPIEEGLVLTLGEGRGLAATLRARLGELRSELGHLHLVVGFDCILRRLEATRLGLEPELAKLYREFGVVGFATYGEQYCGVHVNQTFTGVAIGTPPGPRG